jgi:hypothetical protein
VHKIQSNSGYRQSCQHYKCHQLLDNWQEILHRSIKDFAKTSHLDAVSSMIFAYPSDCLGASDFNEAYFANLKRGIMSVPIFAVLPWFAKSVLRILLHFQLFLLTFGRVFTAPFLQYALEKATGWRVWDDASICTRHSRAGANSRTESSTGNLQDETSPKRPRRSQTRYHTPWVSSPQ